MTLAVLIVAALAGLVLLAIVADRVKRRVGIEPTFDRTKRQYRTDEAVTQQRVDRDARLP